MRLLGCVALALLWACDSGKKEADASVDGAITDTRTDLGSDLGEAGPSSIDAGPPLLTVAPGAIFLQTTAPGGDSPWASLQIRNLGGSPTGELVMSLSGSGITPLTLHRENCMAGLFPARGCTIYISFEPKDVRPAPDLGAEYHATLTIADSEPSGLLATVDITAVAIVPSIGMAIVGPPDLGTVPLGTVGDSLPFILVNTASSDSGWLRLSLSSPQFLKTADLCSGYSLAPAGTCSFAVQFVPATLGFQWAILTVQGSAADTVASEIISGNGR